MNRVCCPKCKGVPKAKYGEGNAFSTHICYQNCGFIFWTLNLCPFCDDPQKTILLKKPNFGQKISCANCNSAMYYFRCPQSECNQLFYKTETSYCMGQLNTCEQCKFQYKTVACPCGGEVKIQKDKVIYEGYSSFTCECCKKNLIYTICPTCKEPEYHLDPLQIGQRIKCSSCKTQRKYIPCPKCGKTLKGSHFSFYQPTHCSDCDVYFQYCKCPYGCSSVSYNYLQRELGPKRACYNCAKKYFVINCKKCEQTLYQENLTESEAIIDNCPHCKNPLQYYLCPCGLFNNQGPNCIRNTCPKPKFTTDNIKRKAQENQKKQNKQKKQSKEGESEENQCKICFNGTAEVINEVCGHILMCQPCLANYRKGKISDAMPCPVCKTIGKYYKYKDPIYS